MGKSLNLQVSSCNSTNLSVTEDKKICILKWYKRFWNLCEPWANPKLGSLGSKYPHLENEEVASWSL